MDPENIETCLRLFTTVKPSAALDDKIARLYPAPRAPMRASSSGADLVLQILCVLLIAACPLFIPEIKGSPYGLSGPLIMEFASDQVKHGSEKLEAVANYLNSQEK